MLRQPAAHTLRVLAGGLCAILGCSQVVQPRPTDDLGGDTGVDATTVDTPISPDISAVEVQPADTTIADVPAPRDGAIFDDVLITASECHELFPSAPVAVTPIDEEFPVNSAGGVVRDGLYELVELRLYLRRASITDTHRGLRVRVRGTQWDYAAYFRRSAAAEGITRLSARFVGEPFASLRRTCPNDPPDVVSFLGHEVRGNQLVLLQRP